MTSGDFGRLYAAHFASVWRTLRRLGVAPAFLDDAAQDVFVTAFRRRGDFEGRSTERTWLLGIALRVASDARRKQRPTETVDETWSSPAPGPEAVTASREEARRVERLLGALAPEKREVLLLVDVEGYSVPEVAEATGANLNTLYTRLRVARQEFEALAREPAKESP